MIKWYFLLKHAQPLGNRACQSVNYRNVPIKYLFTFSETHTCNSHLPIVFHVQYFDNLQEITQFAMPSPKLRSGIRAPFFRILVNSHTLTLTQFILLLGNHQSAPVVRFVPCDTKIEEEWREWVTLILRTTYADYPTSTISRFKATDHGRSLDQLPI